MLIEWGIDKLSAEWRTLTAAPVLLGASMVAGLFVGWLAARFSFRKALTRQSQRLEHYREQISRLQDRLFANVDSYRFNRSELRLLIQREEQTPSSIFYMNISKWCLFDQNFTRIDKEISRNHGGGPVCLFLLFDQPTRGEVLDVTSDAVLPRYEVKEFNDRFAIVAFAEPLPAGTLEITTG